MPDHPQLRSDLRFTLDEATQALTILDPLNGREVELSTLASLVARRMDGQNTGEQIERALKTAHGIDLEPGTALAIAAQLAEINLVRFALEARWSRGQFTRYRGPLKTAQVEVREGLRFECMMCGSCCSGRFAVPLGDADLARLQALPIDLDAAIEVSPQGQPFLRQGEAGCVFLEGRRCGLHAKFGAENKPWVCRAFPWEPLWSPQGGVLRYALACARQDTSGVTGALVAPRARALWEDLSRDLVEVDALPERVLLAPGREVDYGAYLALERGWQQVIQARGWRAGMSEIREAVGLPDIPVGPLLAVAAEALAPFLAESARRLFDGLNPDGRRDAGLLARLATVGGATDGADALTPQTLAVRALLDEGALGFEVGGGLAAGLDRYTLDFLGGRYLFYGDSIASGVILLGVALGLIRRATADAVVGGMDASSATMNAAVLWCQVVLFERDEGRAAVLSRLRLS